MSFIDGDSRDQIGLRPACIDDYVAPDSLVRVVDAFVASLDLAELGFNRAVAAATGKPMGYGRAPKMPSYNLQSVVDVESGLIVPATVAEKLKAEAETIAAEGWKRIPEAPVVQRAVITIGGQVAGADDEDDEDPKPLPDRLVTELTADPGAARQAGEHARRRVPGCAAQVLPRRLLPLFLLRDGDGVSVRSASFPQQAQGLKDTPAAKAIDARHKAWEERLPKDKADLWDWLAILTGEEQAALFAHCASFGVNALY